MGKRTWTENETKNLVDNYTTATLNELRMSLNKTSSSIQSKAYKLGLKRPEGFQRHSHVEILLDGSLQSCYWIGFLLADGTFHKRGNMLRLDQSIKDKDHLLKFKDYIQLTTQLGVTETIKKTGYKSTILHLTCVHSQAVPELVKRFGINHNKTYSPPVMKKYHLTDDQMISLIIGFIDGDGYVKLDESDKKSRVKISIEVHSSWLDNLTYIKTFLYTKSNKMHRYVAPKINKSGLAHTTIACSGVCSMLHDFIKKHNLYILHRKWNQFDYITSDYNSRNVQSGV